MFSLSALLCWSPRRRRKENGEQPDKQQRRGRRRRHIHAKAGLAPLRVTLSDAASGSAGMSPLSDGRASIAFSDTEYHDALEEFPEALSSRSSMDGSHQLSSPGSGTQGREQQLGQHGQQGSLVDRIALWWEGRKATNATAADEAAAAAGAGVTPRTTMPHSPRTPPHSIGSPQLSGVNADELIEPSPESTAKMGCIHLFGASHSLAHKRFLRLSKPAAGSSFRGAAQAEAAGRGDEGAQAAPPSPAASMSSSPSAMSRLLARLSPGTPGPVLQRLLSPRKHRRKTPEEVVAATAAAWEPAEGTTFLVRSPHYMRSKVKEPSGPCIYRLIGVDIYAFDFKIYHIAQHVQLPEAPTPGPEAQALPRDQQLPPLLIINLQLPWYPASLFGANDGRGHSLVYYFALPEGWEPSQVDNKAALALVQRFMHNKREFDGQPTRDRFKLIPRIVNVEEWAEKGPLSGYEHRLLMNYNDKPLLTRPQQRFYTGPNYLEIDLDVHNYAFIARKAFHGFIHRLAPVVFENAFVVQGNRPEELPEQVLAAARVYRCDFDHAIPFPAKSLDELGNGTGPEHDGEAVRH